MEDDEFGDLYADLGCPPSSMPGAKSIVGDEPKIDSNPKADDSSEKGMVDLGLDLSNYSDSDDDFNIVLNEEECPSSIPLKSAAGGEGVYNDEDDDLLLDRKNYDLDDRSKAQKFNERGRNGHHGWHSGSHSVGPSNARTSMCGKGDLYQLKLPCFGGSSFYNQDITAAAHKGFGFSLNQNRTIFDINIEAFDQKPWRRQGVDLTDYFNFGLDEESWKSYSDCMVNYRQQTKMPNDYSCHSNQGGRNPVVGEIVKKDKRWFDMPKGRTIQVGGGFGERQPSTDIRPPRHLDSDVVIQIAMEGSEDAGSILCKRPLKHVEEAHTDASHIVFGSTLYGRVLSPCYEGQDITNPVKHHTSKLNGSTSRGISGEAITKVDCKKDDEENPLRSDACVLEVGSDSRDQDLHTRSSCHPKSHSEGCTDEYSTRKKSQPSRNTHFKQVTRNEDSTESEDNHSHDSRSDTTRTDPEGRKVNAYENNLSVGFNRTRLKNVTQSIVAKGEEQVCNIVHKKHQNNVDLWDVSSRTRKRKSGDGSEVRGYLPYREAKLSPTYKSRTYVAKHANAKSYTKDSQKGDHGTHFERDRDEEDRTEQMECYFSERHHDDRRTRDFAYKGSNQPPLKRNSYFAENDSCLRLAKERDDERWIRMETEYDDDKSDRVYKERHVELTHRRCIPCYDTEENFDRHIYSAGHIQSPVQRNKYDRRSRFDLNSSSRYGDIDIINSRQINHRVMVSHTVEEPYSTGERGWHDTDTQNSGLFISRKSCRFDHRGHIDIRESQFENKGYEDGPSIKGISRSSYENGHESDIDNYIFEQKHMFHENIISNSRMRGCNRRLKSSHCTDSNVRFRQKEQDCLSSPVRHSPPGWSPRNENIHVNQHSTNGHIFSGARHLNNARKTAIVERRVDARVRSNCVSENGRSELTDVGCGEAVNIHMNGWKGKLAKRCSIAAGEQIDTSHGMNDKLKSPKLHKMGYKQEFHLHTSESEGALNRQMSLKADNFKEVVKSSKFDDHSKVSLNNNLLLAQGVEGEEIEEGELIEEPDKKDQICERTVMKNPRSNNYLSKEKTVGTYNNNRILETMAKMEKRKERFKDPIAPKQGHEKSVVNTQSDVSVAMDEVKLQRPARKRRWGGS